MRERAPNHPAHPGFASDGCGRALLDHVPDMVTVSDPDGRIVYANPATERVSGFAPEEFAARDPFERMHPEDRPRCERAFERLLSTPGLSVELEHRVRHKDGDWRWVEGTFASLFDDPEVGGLLATVRDITERKRAEAALRASEERNRLIVAGARDYAIITADPEGRIASWSTGAETVFGWTAEEALGRPAAITFTPEDREAGEPERELATARREGSTPDVRWHLRKDGSRVFIEGTTRALRDGTQVRGFLKIGQDVTERKRTDEALRANEERYRALVENVGDHAIFMLDADGHVTEWTESAERVKGYAPEDVVGRHVSVFYTPEDREAGEPAREFAEAAREGRAEREAWRVRKGGERIWVNEIATAVRDGGGNLVGFAKIARDLTERRELEEHRERLHARELIAHAEATERERISRELHDRVAHHIGVAHQSLELYSALREAAPERAAERLNLARQTTRLALDQTRALSAELKRLQNEELEGGLEAALRTLAESYVPDGVKMGVSFSGEGSAISEPVEMQAYLAMREAVRNAVRHSGCSRIGVTLSVCDGELRGLVEDDGEGFDIEATEKATPSWGVGLRSMRERAEMLGGTMRVDSGPGEGTRVEVRMPRAGRR